MSRRRLISVLSHLHRSLGRRDADGLPDAELLDRFVRLRDEAAFELLVWRHERMVFAVCWRLLRDESDAEDAFQAAFLTLARKAASIGRREAVASWLYKVAYRCALRVRETLRRQRQGVVSGVDPAHVAVCDAGLAAVEDADMHAILDEEVQRLPAKYRAAVVLCYLEGKSYQQAANELGCPAGTLSARLHTARERLRVRLTARGVVAPAALAALASMSQTRAAARLAAVAVQAARQTLAGESVAQVVSSRTLEIATGVMQAMSASKSKWVVALVLMGCLFGTTSWVAVRVLSQAPRVQDADRGDKPVSVTIDGKTVTWQECARLRSATSRASIEFAPDGSGLAALDTEDRLRVWNTSDWRPRWQYRCRPRYGAYVSFFTPFSRDGQLIAVTGSVTDADKPGQRKSELTLLDAVKGREVARLPGLNLQYSPDKATLVTWHVDRLTLWDARTFRKRRELKAAARLTGFYPTFSKDGSLLCLPTKAGRCHLWETATGKERMRAEGFLPELSPNGTTLLTVLPGGIVKIWDTKSGRERLTIGREGRIGCYADFSPDGKQILVRAFAGLTANGLPSIRRPLGRQARIHHIDVCLYDPATGDVRQRLPGDALYDVSAHFSPDGRTVAYSRLEADENEREEVVLWDVTAGRERRVLRTPEGVRPLRFSPDGSTLLSADGFVKNLRLWDVATGKCVLCLPAEVDSVQFSADGQWLAGTPQSLTPQANPSDIRVYHRSDRKLPPPVVREDAIKPHEPPPPSAPPQPEPPKSEARRAFDAVRQQAQQYDQDVSPKLPDAKDVAERERLGRERTAAYERFAATALKVARDFPKDPAALEALEFVLRTTGGGAEGETGKLRDEALTLVLRDQRRSPNLTPLLHAISHQYTDSAEKTLADLAESSPHRTVRGRAAWLLARALADKSEVSREIRALPELLDDPDLAERKARLKRWQATNPDAVARTAEEWYAKVRDRYADVPLNEGNKETLGQSAESGLFALRRLALGKVAPDVEGQDLDGKRFHLKDYRGKVVVLIFCGQWCGPCRQMNPQKQRLVERHADKPFALLEVNSDEDREAIKRAMRKEKLTWRCWFDGGRDGMIARRWGVHSWPTIFILDGKGIIRFKELRGPMLDRIVDRLLKENTDDK